MVIKLIGRTTDFRGKTLWEIVGNLKDFGVGRIVVRSMFERYPEKSFFKILKVHALPNEECRKVKVTAQKTFRGVTYEKPVDILSVSYKADYRLIPKHEEADYTKIELKNTEKILPTQIEFPPLLKEFIKEETGVENPMMKVHFKENRDKRARLAKENETPNVEFNLRLTKLKSPQLFENIEGH